MGLNGFGDNQSCWTHCRHR